MKHRSKLKVLHPVFKDFRDIEIFADKDNNLVIFPRSKSDVLAFDGKHYMYTIAYHPIELFAPYARHELTEKIQEGIEAWNKYPAYGYFGGKNTYEEKYYNIKGFKKAVIGKRFIQLGWDDISGKEVSISWPLKSGYGYYGIESITLADDAGYSDFADAVLKLLELDLTKQPAFKHCKQYLLIER